MTEQTHKALEQAILEAQKSPCAKSKRGVIVWCGLNGSITGGGFNGPPTGLTCDGSDACREACGKVCVHAEMRALEHLRSSTGTPVTDLLHVEVVDGKAVPSGPPSCWQCSRLILDRGIKRVWLLHEDGLRLYSAEDFHIQTLRNCDLPVIREEGGDGA